MILAQTITPPNSLYEAWGLLAMPIPVVVALLALLWRLYCMKTDRTTENALRVRSVLAGMFQRTVLQESRKILRLVQTHLPYSLSQVDSPDPQPSAFDKFCRELRDLDKDELNRDHCRKMLERTLSQVIIDEVEKLLQIAESHSAGIVEGRGNPTGLRASFEGETERTLTFIAQKTVQANNTERMFYRTKTLTFRAFAFSAIAGVLAIPGLFLVEKWAYWTTVAFLLVMAATLVAGIMAWVRSYRCQQWFEDKAERYRVPEDWMSELAGTRTK